MASTPVVVSYNKARSAVLTLLRGVDSTTLPVDLSCDTEKYIPIQRQVFKYITNNTDFTGTGRNPTIDILVSRGYKIDMIWATFQLPAQYAVNAWDQMKYDSLPGIFCLSQIETSIQSAVQLETMIPIAIVRRYIEYYGIKQFKAYARRYWGGYEDVNEQARLLSLKPDSVVLQKLTGLTQVASISNSPAQNQIFPAIDIALPVPACLLFNKEKFNFFIGRDSPIQFKFIFNKIGSILSYTKQCAPTEISGTIDLYIVYLNPNEVSNFWNGLPYTLDKAVATNDYYFVDQYYESNIKTFPLNSDLKMQLKPALSYNLIAYVYPKEWSTGYDYAGTTVAEAAANYLGGMITPLTTNVNPNFTFNFHTGTWLGTGTATSGTLQIVGWAAGATSFKLVWNRTPSNVSVCTINLPVPVDSFGNLYMDISTYNPNLQSVNISDIRQLGGVFYCNSFTINIQPYQATDTSVANATVPAQTFGPAIKLVRGQYTFNPNTANPPVNQTAFWGVTNIVPSSLLVPSQFAFDYLFSQRLPALNKVNPLGAMRFVRLVKNMHPFYDLDGKWPITVIEMDYEKQGSNTEQFFQYELAFYRDNEDVDEVSWSNKWSPQLLVSYNYKNLYDRNKDSKGWYDFRAIDVINFIVKLYTLTVYYDSAEMFDLIKDMINQGREIEITALQASIRILKFTADPQAISAVSDDDVYSLNTQLMQSVLIPHNLFIPTSVPNAAQASRAQKRRFHESYANDRDYYGYDANSSRNNMITRLPPPAITQLSKRPKYSVQY
ncbi:MAG: hypothetical protein E6Q06_02090 [Candidatus Moraniibacteriota bacterium]|nr:MAG: hypothetical protein E6Q06_02090 [Candidatus Moranbacteria bacterium]